MLGIVRLGDTSSHAGIMTQATGVGTCNGLAICVSGNLHSCPINGHGITPVTATTIVVKDNGVSVIRIGDVAGCGAVINSGSTTVLSA